MTISARPTPAAAARRLRALNPRLAVLLALLAALVCPLALAAPAGALVTEVSGTKVGLQPRSEALGEGEAETFANNSGNAIVDGASVYAIYWDPTDAFHIHHEWLTALDGFMQQMGAASGSISNVFAPLAQYRDRANVGATYSTVFKGSYTDSTKYPTAGCTDPEPLISGEITCLTDAQLREQLQSFIASHGLSKGMNTVYYVMTPPGVTVCLDAAATHCSDYSLSKSELEHGEHKSTSYKDSFCSYHGDINPDAAAEGDGNTILYAAIPWTAAGTIDDGYEFPEYYAYAQGYTCQDGGWNPEKHREEREAPKELSKAEKEVLKGESGTAEEKHKLETRIRLEAPHQEEPNEVPGERDSSPGLADLIINQVAEEQANIVTDPLLTSWQDASGHEVTDECRDFFASTAGGAGGEIGGSVTANEETEVGSLFNTDIGSGNFYINNVFSLSDGSCSGGVGLVARFTAPNPVNANEIVGFDGMESTVGLLTTEAFGPSGPPTPTYANFRWNFGDGTEASGYAPDAPTCEAPWLSPCAGSVFHAYQYGGTYKVKLTVTDVAGNVSVVEHEVTVAGPPAPGSAAAGAASPGAATGSSVNGGSRGTIAANPLATAAILSRSLKTVLRKGLVVGYSVNEEVAGHFEVLISRSLARKLKIGGAAATNLPPGMPAQLVIARAILVTTKGGHSTFDIKFSKSVAARLAHTHSAPLILRLIVRNAASKSPVTTTAVASATLAH